MAVNYDIMECTLGPSLISTLWNNLLHYIHCDHHRYQFDLCSLIPYGTMFDGAKFWQMDRSNRWFWQGKFWWMLLPPVRRAMVLLLLYYMPLLPLSLLLIMFHTPQHMRTLYQINILKDQVTIFWYAELFFTYVRRIGLKN